MKVRQNNAYPVTGAVKLLACQLAVWTSLACAFQPLLAQVSSPAGAGDRQRKVLIVDQAGLDALRAGGKYVLSEPRGEISATAPCVSGSADAQCVEAAHQRLQEEATRRGANLILMTRMSSLQSYPPQYAAAGILYEISSRR